jgi:S1-C subfamily serine protease
VALLLAVPSPPADLTVSGIVLGAGRAGRVALLRAGDRARAVAVGESAFGGRVVAIEPGGVTLDFEGQRVTARLEVSLRPPSSNASAAMNTAVVSFSRVQVQRRLAAEAPSILDQVAPGLLTEAGLQSGDVLTQVDDVRVEGLASLASVYPRLQDAAVITAHVLRGGQPLVLTVQLR